MEAGDTEAVKLILAEDTYPTEALNPHFYQALKKGRLAMAKALLASGADPNYVSGEFSTPLLSSAMLWFPRDSVIFLVPLADPNATDDLGRTPAHLLVLYRAGNLSQESPEQRLEIFKALALAGADFRLRADDGSTVRSLAETHKAQLLLDYLKTNERTDLPDKR